MSFSRAKLQRFNEKPSHTPSPADYSPSLKSRGPGSVKSEKILDNASVRSKDSCFRTPNSVRKKQIHPNSATKPKPTALFKTIDSEVIKDLTVECNNKDDYIKDLVEQIEEMKAQQSNLVTQRDDLQNEKKQFEIAVSKLEEKHKVDIDNLSQNFSEEKNSISDSIVELNFELKCLKDQHNLLKEQNKIELDLLSVDINKFNDFSTNYSNEILKKSESISKLEDTLEKLKTALNTVEKNHKDEIEKLKTKQKIEIEDIEFEMLKTVTESTRKIEKEKDLYSKRLTDFQKQSNVEIVNLTGFHEREISTISAQKTLEIARIESSYKEANGLTEIEMQEKLTDIELIWKSKLDQQETESNAILKECEAISNYTIIQSEIEKNKTQQELSLINEELATLSLTPKTDLTDRYHKLKTDFDCLIRELQQLQTNFEVEKSERMKDRKQISSDSQAYQVQINNTHQIIDALKRRIFESDRDVEQLKTELDYCEQSKTKFEDKINKMEEELQTLSNLNEDLEIQQESTLKTMKDRIREIEKDMIEKTEQYRRTVSEAINQYNDKLEQKDCELKDVTELLHRQQDMNSEVCHLIHLSNVEVQHLENRNEDLLEQVGTLERELQTAKDNRKIMEDAMEKLEVELAEEKSKNEKLKEELEAALANAEEVEMLTKQVNQLQQKSDSYYKYCEYYKGRADSLETESEDMGNINKKYIDQSKKYEELLQKLEELEERNGTLEKTVVQNELLIGPFREQLEAYEVERNLLLNQKSFAENEAKEIGLKFAETLGHQNQKQKIKHLVDLKEKNLELVKMNQALDVKVRSHSKTIEKLKKELSVTKSPMKDSNKENVDSPRKTYTSSPMRDKN